MTLYNLRTALDGYRITKWDSDMNPESSYLIGGADHTDRVECECPAGSRSTCRHRQMLQDLIPLVDTEFFWDFERHYACDANGMRAPLQPHSPTVTTPDFDSGDGGSIPPAAANIEDWSDVPTGEEALTPSTPWRRI